MGDSAAPRVLIASASDWEGLSRAPYLYAQAGWNVDAFASAKSFLAHSSFVQELHADESDPSDFAEHLGVYMQQHGSKYDKVIIGDDPLLWELARRREKPWARALLPCPGTDSQINFIISKLDFVRECKAHGIPLPLSIICKTPEEVRAAALSTGFPLVLKQDHGYGGEGVRIIGSMQELEALTLTAEVLIQKFVDGQICSASALYKQGRLVGFYSYTRLRTWGALGASTAIQFRQFPGLLKILQDLGHISSFDGQCGIDFMCEHGSSNVLVLEQNFRPTLTMLLGRKVGVDFAACLRHWNNPPMQPLLQNADATFEVPLFPSDVIRAISAKELSSLMRWLSHPLWLRELSWYDFRLLRHNAKYIARFTANKALHFLHRSADARNTGRS